MAKEGDEAQIRMPSGEVRIVRLNCKASIGQVGNIDHENISICLLYTSALMAVTNGVMPEESDNMFAGKLLTFESGAPGSFQTFEAFYDAVKAQIKYAIDEAHANLLICEKLLAEQFNLPTFTVLLEGALEKGKDATAGGAKVNVGPTMRCV